MTTRGITYSHITLARFQISLK